MKKKILIIGGAQGVGLELARQYRTDGHTLFVTGAKDPALTGAEYHKLCITQDATRLAQDIDRILARIPVINTLIYTEQVMQAGQIETLTDDDLGHLVNAGVLAPMMLVQRLKRRTDTTLKLMLITSQAEHMPLADTPVSCALASGLGMLGNALVRDPQLGKVLVVAAAGPEPATNAKVASRCDPELHLPWIAAQIIELSGGPFKYKYARILTDPLRSEVLTCRSDFDQP